MDRPDSLRLIVRHKVPSLNVLFSMNPWQRRKEKIATQHALLSALKVSAGASSIPITCAENFLSMLSGTLQQFLGTEKKISTCKSLKRRSGRRRRNIH